MLALVAAVVFLISLIVQLVGLPLGILTVDVLNTLGFLLVALHLGGVLAGSRTFSRRR